MAGNECWAGFPSTAWLERCLGVPAGTDFAQDDASTVGVMRRMMANANRQNAPASSLPAGTSGFLQRLQAPRPLLVSLARRAFQSAEPAQGLLRPFMTRFLLGDVTLFSSRTESDCIKVPRFRQTEAQLLDFSRNLRHVC